MPKWEGFHFATAKPTFNSFPSLKRLLWVKATLLPTLIKVFQVLPSDSRKPYCEQCVVVVFFFFGLFSFSCFFSTLSAREPSAFSISWLLLTSLTLCLIHLFSRKKPPKNQTAFLLWQSGCGIGACERRETFERNTINGDARKRPDQPVCRASLLHSGFVSPFSSAEKCVVRMDVTKATMEENSCCQSAARAPVSPKSWCVTVNER